MKRYKVLKNKENIFYDYSVVAVDEVNDIPICYTTSKGDAEYIAEALNNFTGEKKGED